MKAGKGTHQLNCKPLLFGLLDKAGHKLTTKTTSLVFWANKGSLDDDSLGAHGWERNFADPFVTVHEGNAMVAVDVV